MKKKICQLCKLKKCICRKSYLKCIEEEVNHEFILSKNEQSLHINSTQKMIPINDIYIKENVSIKASCNSNIDIKNLIKVQEKTANQTNNKDIVIKKHNKLTDYNIRLV